MKEHSIGSISHLLKKPLSESATEMLKEVFGLEPKQMLASAFVCVGNGYNILNDEIKPFALFKMDKDTLQETSYGIKIPKGMELSTIQESETFMEHFKENREYIENRLNQLGVSADFDVKLFKMNPRGGFSSGNSKNDSFSSVEHSFFMKNDFSEWM